MSVALQSDLFGDLPSEQHLGEVGLAVVEAAKELFAQLANLDLHERVEAINQIRATLHRYSAFAAEPVDCVQWVSWDRVRANDYNPNTVAPPEMQLLERSIESDGYTQPIVAWAVGDEYEVVDGFHRNRVARECRSVRDRVRGYLPLSIINTDREERGDRIAATIRHNRARGKHRVDAMSDIVVELRRRNWSNTRIGRELGMDEDEILRLCQVTGLAELFADQEFSKSWDVEGEITEADYEALTDDISTYEEEIQGARTVNTSDPDRIFHHHDKWECLKAGFYANTKNGMTKQQCEEAYRQFFSDTPRFADALEHVISEWKYSCEHYLTNVAMNRIAWLGQAAACYAISIPSTFRSGFSLLSPDEQEQANQKALEYLNQWLVSNKRAVATMEEALSHGRQSDIY